MASFSSDIEVLFVRHAESQSNALWKERGVDPWIFDPLLSENGYQQAIHLKNNICFVPDLIVSSPLKRALLTAGIIFGGTASCCRWVVHPLASEQVSEADDIGSLKRDLMVEFPFWDWSLVCDGFWWYIPHQYKSVCQSLIDHQSLFRVHAWEESEDDLEIRIGQFLDWLQDQPAEKIIVFTHGDYIDKIVGGDDETPNCGYILRTYSRQKKEI